jgi:tight adherence protein B
MDLMLILYIGGGFSILMLVIGIVVSVSSERAVVEERLGKYVEGDDEEIRKQQTPLTDWLNQKVERSSFGDSISKELARADLKLKPGEYIALMLIAAVGVGIVVWYIGGMNMIGGLIGAIIGLFLPRLYVNNRKSKRVIKFGEQLPDMLNLMVNGLLDHASHGSG